MFGSGNKDKLRENMEEIKQMVEDGETMEPSESEDGFKPVQEEPDFEDAQKDVSEEDIESFGNELEQEFQKQQSKESGEPQNAEGTLEDESMQGQSQQKPADKDEHAAKQEKIDNRQSQTADKAPSVSEPPHSAQGGDSKPERQDISGPQQDTSNASRNPKGNNHSGQQSRPRHQSRKEAGNKKRQRDDQPNTRGLEADIPEPARTKEISVPDIDKGPLFIRREKFEQASRLIQEMRYLSEQVEATVNTIEEDLQRDQQTESQVKELLNAFEEDRTDVERIVSPKEN